MAARTCSITEEVQSADSSANGTSTGEERFLGLRRRQTRTGATATIKWTK
jgi:hypothetical protein